MKPSPRAGAGERFESAFKRALQQVEAGVTTHVQPFKHFHRVCLPDYPYNLCYRLVGDRAVITALLYSRFDPKRIQKTLGQRI
jgi:plasmid stabilization system protein ParE